MRNDRWLGEIDLAFHEMFHVGVKGSYEPQNRELGETIRKPNSCLPW